MTLRIYIPVDAAALAVGAEEVASALHSAAARHNVAVDLVRELGCDDQLESIDASGASIWLRLVRR